MLHRAISGVLIALIALAILPWCANAASEERIAFQRNDPPAVTVMFADGTGAVDLAPSPKFTDPCVTPALSPDGHTLVFSARVGDQFKLFTWRLDESNNAVDEPQRLTPDDSGYSEKFPSWSPDGKHIAFLSIDRTNQTTLRLVDADGANLKTLAPAAYFATPMWSTDGQFLLYIALVNDKPVLQNINVSGGKGLPIRPDSRITAACYSPDGKQIAVLMQRTNGISDLYIIPPFGIGGRKVLTGIVSGKSLCWRHPDTIMFNAARVGEQSGKAFWTVTPSGEGLKGITGYADPKTVAYFSVEKCDMTPYVPVAMAPDAGGNSPNTTETPQEQPQDLMEQLTGHAITIISPADRSTIQGKEQIKIVAQKNIASITLLIGNQFIFTTATQDYANPVPRITYNWDTQDFAPINPTVGFPTTYDASLRFPDGAYQICAQAFDDANKLVDQHTITVTVKNGLSADIFPSGIANLHYTFTAKSADAYYRIHGDATLLGTQSLQVAGLNATLDAAFRRSVVKSLHDGAVGFRTEIRGPNDRSALTYGQAQDTLPEFQALGYYALDPLGELTVASSGSGKAYLPLTQLSLPFQNTAVKIGESWQKPMWVVTDLLDREATEVMATHTLDGFELIDGRRTVRIRSDYRVTVWMAIHLTPTQTTPSERGARALAQSAATPPAFSPNGGNLMPMTAPAPALPPPIMARDIVGVRYSWFDPEAQELVVLNDRILHTIPLDNLPANTTGVSKTPPAYDDGTRAWYLVHYQYTVLPDPHKVQKHP